MFTPNEVLLGTKLDASQRRMYFIRKENGKIRRIGASYANALIGRGVPLVSKGN